jgi:hypothetical protein
LGGEEKFGFGKALGDEACILVYCVDGVGLLDRHLYTMYVYVPLFAISTFHCTKSLKACDSEDKGVIRRLFAA